jgi:hypothetical protein
MATSASMTTSLWSIVRDDLEPFREALTRLLGAQP